MHGLSGSGDQRGEILRRILDLGGGILPGLLGKARTGTFKNCKGGKRMKRMKEYAVVTVGVVSAYVLIVMVFTF